MNMIEVDPKLFVKCRLCLDETGIYQIVPNVQMQIKYCFDIEVKPFDGLPQLVCKKCETVLSQYARIKQTIQEKQKDLICKLNSNVKENIINQQQQNTVSSTQIDTEHKNKEDDPKSLNITTNITTNASKRNPSTEDNFSTCIEKKKKTTPQSHKLRKQWQYRYVKNFTCQFCSKSFKDKNNMNNHIANKQCKLYTKYSSIVNTYCLVGMNKIDMKHNITGSNDNVVYNKNKIIQTKNGAYYVCYTLKSNEKKDSSTSSDEDFPINKSKRKQRRLYSRSSNETIVIEQNTAISSEDEKEAEFKKTEQIQHLKVKKILSDIECVNIDDSDSNSTKSSVKTRDSETSQRTTIHDKMLNNIITMCTNKYKKRLTASGEVNTSKGKEESSLKHKVLSIGRKVIHSKGINTTGLLRYMEHKNLEVVWVPNLDKKVTIKTRQKESTDNENSNFGWEDITSLQNNNYVTEDFVNILERKNPLEVITKQNIKDKPTNKVNSTHQVQISDKEKEGSAALYLNSRSKLQASENDTKSHQEPAVTSPNQNDLFERKTADSVHLRAALASERNWKKLLNANPVANPKQLPKKTNFGDSVSNNVKVHTNEIVDSQTDNNEISLEVDKSNDISHLPVITSIASLAQVENENIKKASTDNDHTIEVNFKCSKQQATFPKIKVKPVRELMSEKALSQHHSPFVATTGWTVNNENQSILMQPTGSDIVYMTGGPSYTNVFPLQKSIVCYPKNQDGIADFNASVSAVNQSGATLVTQQREYVTLHTVELPNTKTDSPLRYLQRLLKIHNIHLLDSNVSYTMQCLTKFKVIFEQESNSPVKLCLFLLCQNNEFCIKAKDHNLRDLDIPSFSANWQWEILKVFRGDDIVPKLLSNALRYGTAVHDITTYFINLLKSIEFTKDE